MNKAKLKSYAPQARKDFIAAVTARANLLGLSEKAGKLEVATSQPQGDATVIAGQAWPIKVHSQRQQLIARIQKDGFAQTMEAVAYTWFNRFAALRYMELHDYLGHGHRALSSLEGTLPDILAHAADLAQNGADNGGLPGLKPALVTEMKLAGNRDGELYRLLLVAQCNALSNVMPFLFERIDDETELLLPDNLLRTDSVIAKLVTTIDEEDWEQVEIIGWLYQFYISEKKDEVIGKVVKSEDIPAATQLFTPNWIVQYLVQNTVGRLWLMADPVSTLKARMPYYIAPADQGLEAQAQLDALIQTRIDEDGDSLNPESITLLDPACGSGHILVEAYEVLKAIYLERGYQPRSIPRLILEKNLYGLDIDDRAAQMAGFALLMKARADDRRLFNEPIRLNVLSLQESKGLDADELSRALQAVASGIIPRITDSADSSGFGDGDLFHTRPQRNLGQSTFQNTANNLSRPTIAALVATFAHAKTFGSLIPIPEDLQLQLAAMEDGLHLALKNGDLYAKAAAQDLIPLVKQAQLLGMQFDAVVANPPYMGGKYLTPALKIFLNDNYRGFEKDMFSAFMVRDLRLTKESGQLGFMSPFVWMFISSYLELRQNFIDNATLTSLVQLEYSGFDGATVPICAFTLSKAHVADFIGSYIRLSDFRGSDQQGPKTLEAISSQNCGWFYTAKSDDFKKIPGNPIAYWMGDNFIRAIENSDALELYAMPKKGMITLDDARFTRRWFEVNFQMVQLGSIDSADALKSGASWFPITKGGGFRKWAGCDDAVVNWKCDGREIKEHIVDKYGGGSYTKEVRSESFYFKPAISWGLVTSGSPSFRNYPAGFIIGNAGPCMYLKSDAEFILPLLNSCVAQYVLKIMCPTINFAPGDLSRFPIPKFGDTRIIQQVSRDLICHHEADWNESELSWSYMGNALTAAVKRPCALTDSFNVHSLNIEARIQRVRILEEQNNKFFINAYGLQGELSPEVPDSQITLARADREKDCQRLISYAIGCMMGRYSLDAPGLIYANAGNVGFNASRYCSYPADADGIVPLTSELWFEDEAASRIREFLLAVWGADTLAENMVWLAESLGIKAGETPDETIRRYLADKFYKDHLQTYKKRPIYWLFSSGKQGAFQALVYLHRYHEGTLSRIRAEYVVPLTGKIQFRIDMLEKDAVAASSTAARNKLSKEVEKLKRKHVELLAYDEQLRHYADMRITLDLDDGVKVNYGKFGNLLAEVKAVTGGASDD
jgi:type II restriction/modification system DNA methylase subunit YeeA